jgi:soluble lytic murein transglycosylase-like protein
LGIVLTALLAAGAGVAQAEVLEVHVDGSVVSYDGAIQRMSPGANPTARLLTPGQPTRRHAHGRTYAPPPPETAAAIHDSAERHQVSERLVEAVAWRESGFNSRAVSPKGARGTMQLMPGTARALGVDPSDMKSNIDGGANYLSQMMRRFNGDQTKALAAYNAGPRAVERYGGVPPYAETKAYVESILGRLSGSTDALAAASEFLKARMGAL